MIDPIDPLLDRYTLDVAASLMEKYHGNEAADRIRALRPEPLNWFIARRWDELMAAGKHGHYESLFQLVHEALERERNA